jgi:four helix bundle protein
MLAHEKLHVYAKALAFVAAASAFSATWSKKHAVVDQLGRASESLILNLADGARLRSASSKLRSLDYALGSSLECAACLDIAQIKSFLSQAEADREKRRLCEIVRMLVGLRKAWETWQARDDSVPYRTEPSGPAREPLFHHETLEVYGAALELMAWLVSLPGGKELSSRLYRQIDEGLTSIVLNIAEANGRYSELDHRRFLDVAEGAAVKVAAYLDLAVQKLSLGQQECGSGKALLERIAAMLSRM